MRSVNWAQPNRGAQAVWMGVVTLLTACALILLTAILFPPSTLAHDAQADTVLSSGQDQFLSSAPTAIGDLAYVTLSNSDVVALVDTASHFVGTVDVGAAGCEFPWRATMSPDGSHVYVGCYNSGNVAVIETAGNTVLTTVGGIPDADGIAFTRDGAYALVGSRRSSQIVVVDTATHFISHLSTPDAPRSVVAHPYLDRAYATCADGTILVIDTTTFSITTAIPVGSDPWDVAISRDGQWVFASDRRGAGLAIIDTDNNTVHTTMAGLGDLTGLEIAPDGSEVYACGLGSGVHVIDGTTFAHITTIPGLGNAWEAAVTCDGSELYVGSAGDQVPVVDTATHSVTDHIAMPGSAARGIATCPQYVATGVILSPPAQTNEGARGEMVAHQETLVNATGATDSFSLTLGSHVWDTALSTDSLGPIANGDSAAFTVYVTVPVGVDWYLTDTVVVSATSVASPTVYSDTATFTTRAYAPPQIGVSPDVLTSTQYVNEIVDETLTISNGNGVVLEFEIGGGPEVSFFAASTELYGYDVPDAWLRVIGTQDDTNVQVINLDSGAVIDENTDLDRYGTWDVYPSDGTSYKVESDKPVLGYESDQEDHSTFVPSVDSGPIGREFIFYYHHGAYFYVFAVQNAIVEVYDSSGGLAASRTMSAGEYWDLSLSNAVYHVISTGRIAMQNVGSDGYTTLPSIEGNGLGRRFYFATYEAESWHPAAFAVFAYQDVDVNVYDLDSGSLLHSRHINQGDYWWQTNVGTRRLRLESTGKVEVWAGSTQDGNEIQNLGDDLSFAGGDGSREYYLHSLMDGSVIFALFDNTRIDVDGDVYNLNKDEYLHLDGCCYFRHIQSNQPILIQTLGRDGWWDNLGTYLGGVLEGGGSLPPWLTMDPISGTVTTNGATPVQVTFDATGLQPDTYSTQIVIQSNDPVTPSISVPVTMTVLPTAGMGWVEGTVTDARTGDPLEATIIAFGQPYTITSDLDTGSYTFWLDEGSYTLQVTAEGYVTQTTAMDIVAQQGTTQDFALVQNVPVMEVSPGSLQVTHYVDDVTTMALTITNNGPAPLDFSIGTEVSFFAASTELYGYDVPDAWLRVVGTEDNTHVLVVDLDTGTVITEDTDLDRYETWDVYPNDGTFYKVESSKPVLGYESDFDFYSGWHNTFVPSLNSGPVGTEFIFFYGRDHNMPVGSYVFAMEDTSVEVYDTTGSLVASQSISAGEYWELSLADAVYHVISTGRIAIELAGGDGYTTVPSCEGNGVGDRFYFVTDGYFTGAFVVFAYEDADADVYDLDSGSLLYSQHIDQGDYWWQTSVGTRRLRLESTGKVEVWGGDAENGNEIENLGDDVSFAGGDGGREYYLHSLMDGSVIFALFDNTQVDVDGDVYNLNKDEYWHLDGCCYLRHIRSSQPILIQTLGRDSWWNNLGTYLGGVLARERSLPDWLMADPVTGTVPAYSSVPVQVTFDATGVRPGIYSTEIVIRSNDPVTPTTSVPVTMTVVPVGQVFLPTIFRSYAVGPWYVAPGGDDGNDCLSPATPCATIAGAIAKASSGHTVYAGSGTYTGTGDEVVLLDKDVTLSGGWDAGFTAQSGTSTIDGEETRRGITVDTGVTALIDRFTVQNGYTDDGNGGGIHNSGILTVTNSIINDNFAEWSGYADHGGGGISNIGALSLNHCTVSNNTSTEGGGGIWGASGSSTVILDTQVYGNTAIDCQGGGIEIYTDGHLTVSRSWVVGNSAVGNDGGGLSIGALSFYVENTVIAGNYTSRTGGGIWYAEGGPGRIVNSHIIGNEADDHGSAMVGYSSAQVELTNTLVISNTGNTGIDDQWDSGAVFILNYCDTYGNAPDGTGNVTILRTNCLGTLPKDGLDPLMAGGALPSGVGPAFADEWMSYDYRLLPGSPAIDAGTAISAPATDIEGNPRDATPDMGAYELANRRAFLGLPAEASFGEKGWLLQGQLKIFLR